MTQPEQSPVNFFDHVEEINQEVSGKDIFLFLDYDGTLTPIVATPDLAVLSDAMRDTVRKVAQKQTVSIVSGRRNVCTGTADETIV